MKSLTVNEKGLLSIQNIAVPRLMIIKRWLEWKAAAYAAVPIQS